MEDELEIKIEVYRNGEMVVRGSGYGWNSAEAEFYKLQRFDEKQQEKEKWRCPECGEIREGDERVEAGMKCGACAY